MQKPGIDYEETYSPVARYESVRTLLALAAAKKMHLKQFDVKTAFLHGELQESNVFMNLPQGFNKSPIDKVCLLKKSLYGLKQASRCWNKKFVQCLKKFNLKASPADPCVFISQDKDDNEKLFLVIYIDDGLIACKNKKKIQQLIDYLRQNLEITDSKISMFLGIELSYLPDGSILAKQEQYAKRVLERFRMFDANPVTVPADSYQNLSMFNEENSKPINCPYREAVGSLIFLATVSRPDIIFAVGAVSRHAHNPTKAHLNAVKRILKYIKGTADFGVVFSATTTSSKLEAFSDSDFAGDIATRKSTSGYVLKFNGSPVSWGSRRQNTVALSTAESEYVAACTTIQETLWMKRLIYSLCSSVKRPVLCVDNKSAINMIKNSQFNKLTRHIDVKYHFIQDVYDKKLFNLVYMNTENQQADIFTKPLSRKRFEFLRSAIGVFSEKTYNSIETLS